MIDLEGIKKEIAAMEAWANAAKMWVEFNKITDDLIAEVEELRAMVPNVKHTCNSTHYACDCVLENLAILDKENERLREVEKNLLCQLTDCIQAYDKGR